MVLLLVGCKGSDTQSNSVDVFYQGSTASWDALRIPLIKPYEALKLNGSNEWIVSLKQTVGAATNIKELNVVDNLIVLHSGNSYCNYEEVDEAWYLIIPVKQQEVCFLSEREFSKYLDSRQIAKPKFHPVDTVFGQFTKTNKIDWKKDFK